MYVVIDTREQDRKYEAFQFYQKKVDHATIGELPTGDYIFFENPKDKKEKVVWEYKTVNDFIESIKDGRVFNQSIDQNLEFKYHYVIIVGTDAEAEQICDGMEIFDIDNYYGAMDRLSTYTNIRQAPNQKRAFKIMLNTSKKCLEDKTIFKQFPKNFGNPASRYLCYCVDHVGKDTATLIAEKLKLENLDDLIRLNEERLIDIKGIGEKTAKNILETIKRDRIFCEDDENQMKLI